MKDGVEETFLEPPYDDEHSCEDSLVQIHGLRFFEELLEECKKKTDIAHPTLHNLVAIKYRNFLTDPYDQALFDSLVVKEYSFDKVKSTMHRRRVEVKT